MKNIFSILAIITGMSVSAQVGIGTQAVPSNNYVSVEFGTAAPLENKGLILPWVTNASTMNNSPVGTLVFDSATQKVLLGTSNTPSVATTPTSSQTKWFDLSNGASAPATPFVNPTTASGEALSAKTIIGAGSSPVDGILVLETPNADTAPKAMVLPRVNSFADIVNPSPGMMVYVKTNKRLAVYNGSQWSFWQPAN